jgi:hypothetical protein
LFPEGHKTTICWLSENEFVLTIVDNKFYFAQIKLIIAWSICYLLLTLFFLPG